MRRADRLFQIIQYLREGKLLTAQKLAERLEVSQRTIYRDIADLQASSVPIDGEAGIGYLMRDGYDLPPIMFTQAELSSLVIGARMIEAWGGEKMAENARAALSKIAIALPDEAKNRPSEIPVYAPDNLSLPKLAKRIDTFNEMVASHKRVVIHYEALSGEKSQRKVDPLGLVYWGKVWTLLCWCYLRNDFRTFRLDRIVEYQETGERFEAATERSLEAFLKKEGRGHERISPAGL